MFTVMISGSIVLLNLCLISPCFLTSKADNSSKILAALSLYPCFGFTDDAVAPEDDDASLAFGFALVFGSTPLDGSDDDPLGGSSSLGCRSISGSFFLQVAWLLIQILNLYLLTLHQ